LVNVRLKFVYVGKGKSGGDIAMATQPNRGAAWMSLSELWLCMRSFRSLDDEQIEALCEALGLVRNHRKQISLLRDAKGRKGEGREKLLVTGGQYQNSQIRRCSV
jgi:hypothetical protein